MHYVGANLGENWVKIGDTLIGTKRKGSFVSGSRCLCQISSKSVKNSDRESADRQTDKQTDRDDRGDLIICPMLCYSNGTDNKLAGNRNNKRSCHSKKTDHTAYIRRTM